MCIGALTAAGSADLLRRASRASLQPRHVRTACMPCLTVCKPRHGHRHTRHNHLQSRHGRLQFASVCLCTLCVSSWAQNRSYPVFNNGDLTICLLVISMIKVFYCQTIKHLFSQQKSCRVSFAENTIKIKLSFAIVICPYKERKRTTV